MCRLPIPKYCPNPYSINSSGIPIKSIIREYGIRKAPENETSTQQIITAT